MRVLAIDPGSKRVGLAVSDPGGLIAQPLDTLSAEPEADLAERLAAVATRVGAEELVVGLPRRLDGSEGPEARAARELAGELRRRTGLRVALVDERLSSAQAERSLIAQGARRARRRQVGHSVAAALILQSYLARR
ncbi:MAG TPA: Holliday junction resolvase RuvX [Candidatus Acidoferrales bacterium]|nr:Holliday junction resolvase RuvX [Candidatus Acidoferrales bacterium]